MGADNSKKKENKPIEKLTETKLKVMFANITQHMALERDRKVENLMKQEAALLPMAQKKADPTSLRNACIGNIQSLKWVNGANVVIGH